MQTQTNIGEPTRSIWFPSEGRIEEILFADALPIERREQRDASGYSQVSSRKSPRQGYFTDRYEP